MDLKKIGYMGKWCVRKGVQSVSHTKYSTNHYIGKNVMTVDEANKKIFDSIIKGTPFMAGRLGAAELNVVWRASKDCGRFEVPAHKATAQLNCTAGFFPNEEDECLKFVDIMRWSVSQLDLTAVWFNPMEDYIIDTYGNDLNQLCTLRGLEPFFSSTPWSAAMEGKRVLVIHPFVETIVSQWERRDFLFDNKKVLPQFDLRVQRAVQTIAGNKDERFADWFEALDFMFEEAIEKEFDVAIIGCGAYGFPLAAKLKQAGKVAIHMGGATQLLFGIRGSRWEKKVEYENLMNEHWIRPQERPQNAELVENGCYW